MIKNKNIFITGGAGFLGGEITKRLLNDNRIIIYDNLTRDSVKYTDILEHKNITFIQGDVLDFAHIKKTVDEYKPEIVIHMAAVVGIDKVIINPVHTIEVDFIGTYNVLKALEPNISNVEKFLYLSTSEVFGAFAYNVDETHTTNLSPVGEARWTYQISKLAGEHLLNGYYKMHGLPIVIVRPFNIYGAYQTGTTAMGIFIKQALKNETITIHGSGNQIRSWCYVDDFMEGIMACLGKDVAIGNVFNIGNPNGTLTINFLAQMVIDQLKSSSAIKHVPQTAADVELRIPSIEKAVKLLGYEPKVSLQEGILKMAEWFKTIDFG